MQSIRRTNDAHHQPKPSAETGQKRLEGRRYDDDDDSELTLMRES